VTSVCLREHDIATSSHLILFPLPPFLSFLIILFFFLFLLFFSSSSRQLLYCRNSASQVQAWVTVMRVAVVVDSSWNVMAHGDAREGKWRGNWWMEWVASILYTKSEHGVSSITTADAYTSAASSRLNWRPHRFKWTSPFRRKTKSGFCRCALTFQLASTPNIKSAVCTVVLAQRGFDYSRLKIIKHMRKNAENWKH
jgi:hypothetical protein